ncbi:MAG: hypothetical protein QW101_06195 [Ignisphaera sp.]
MIFTSIIEETLQSALASLERIYEILIEKKIEDDDGIEINRFRRETYC